MLDLTPRGGTQARPDLALREAFAIATHGPSGAPLVGHGLFVALFDLSEWSPWQEDATSILTPDEQRRVSSRRLAKDRAALAMTYALHRLLLARVLGCDASAVPLFRDEAGCPQLAGCTLSTSLSHAESRAAAVAISAAGPVGVDLEATSRAPAMHGLSDWVCHPSELDRTNAAASDLANEALLGLWVRKEAFLKAAGTGLRLDMCSFPAPDCAVLPLPGGGRSEVRMLDAGQGWLAAVAGAPGVSARCAWLHPPL